MTTQVKALIVLAATIVGFTGGCWLTYSILQPRIELERQNKEKCVAANKETDKTFERYKNDVARLKASYSLDLKACQAAIRRVQTIDNGGQDVASSATGSTGDFIVDELNGMWKARSR